MGVEIDTDELQVAFEELGRDQIMEAANRAFSSSQEVLYEEGDDEDYNVYPVAQSGQPPEWDESRGGAVFTYHHPASYFFEVGTQTHPVVAQDAEVLAFEWEDAPPKVQEMFEDSFPTVFLPKTNVSGITALRYVRGGLDEAARWLEGQ